MSSKDGDRKYYRNKTYRDYSELKDAAIDLLERQHEKGIEKMTIDRKNKTLSVEGRKKLDDSTVDGKLPPGGVTINNYHIKIENAYMYLGGRGLIMLEHTGQHKAIPYK